MCNLKCSWYNNCCFQSPRDSSKKVRFLTSFIENTASPSGVLAIDFVFDTATLKLIIYNVNPVLVIVLTNIDEWKLRLYDDMLWSVVHPLVDKVRLCRTDFTILGF